MKKFLIKQIFYHYHYQFLSIEVYKTHAFFIKYSVHSTVVLLQKGQLKYEKE